MSKIYEALLQAEKDRAATKQETSAAPKAARDDSPASIPSTSPAIEMIFPAPDERSVSSLVAETPTRLSPPPAAARPSGVFLPETLRAWKPDLSKLPAVMPRGRQIEQFRSLRSRLFEFQDLNKLKTLLVSSGQPAEGKSFVAVNLAIMLARHKSARVLLIDGDMRRSTLHHLLGAPSEPGLAEYLMDKSPLSDILQQGNAGLDGTPVPPGLATLSFIAAGNAGDKAADLSGSARFNLLIDTLAPQFDWIIVDSSPVNLVTDGVNLARACDAVLLIARSGVTRFEAAQRAVTELKASKILGFVLNAVEDAPATENYYGYESYNSPASLDAPE